MTSLRSTEMAELTLGSVPPCVAICIGQSANSSLCHRDNMTLSSEICIKEDRLISSENLI